MDSKVNAFDVMILFAGVKTKEGLDFSSCVRKIEYEPIDRFLTVYFENRAYFKISPWLSIFRFNAGLSSCTMYNERRYGSANSLAVSSDVYWKELKEAIMDIASFYEF